MSFLLLLPDCEEMLRNIAALKPCCFVAPRSLALERNLVPQSTSLSVSLIGRLAKRKLRATSRIFRHRRKTEISVQGILEMFKCPRGGAGEKKKKGRRKKMCMKKVDSSLGGKLSGRECELWRGRRGWTEAARRAPTCLGNAAQKRLLNNMGKGLARDRFRIRKTGLGGG